MEFYQTNTSEKDTFARRLGATAMQWSKGVKATSPGVYPSLKEGQLVRLDITTGEVIAATGADEASIGIVLVPNTENNNQRVTILTQGIAIVRMGSTAAVAPNAFIKSIGMNTTVSPNRPNATAAGAGDYAIGVALTEASGANEEIEVLIYASPTLIA